MSDLPEHSELEDLVFYLATETLIDNDFIRYPAIVNFDPI